MTIAYACDCMYMCVNFEEEFFFLRRGECKTREKTSIFLKKGENGNCWNSTG